MADEGWSTERVGAWELADVVARACADRSENEQATSGPHGPPGRSMCTGS